MTRNQTGTKRQRDHYDRQQRDTAALIQHDHPGWLVLYGPWSRMFWAYSARPAPPGRGLVLSARDPNDLAAQIRQAHETATATSPHSQPPAKEPPA